MKITMSMTEDAFQFNLEAETEPEKMFVKCLSKHSPGTVEVHQGANLSECQGGYIRNFGPGGSSVCAVTIKRGPSSTAKLMDWAPEEELPHRRRLHP